MTGVQTCALPIWGEIVASSGSMADINPLRYRGYYYDTETGFYYLQSRYYDPANHRFINADSYYDTATGFLGYNMFSYCNNDPILYCDPEGDLAYPGEIHNQVVEHIKKKYDLNSEQRITYKDSIKWGRADLISDDGQVWEVKRDKPRQIERGKSQVKKYSENIWKNSPNTELSIGGHIESGEFDYESGHIIYHVKYRYAGDGVIAYDYTMELDQKKVRQTVTAALGVLGVIGLGYLVAQTGGALAPVLGGAYAFVN